MLFFLFLLFIVRIYDVQSWQLMDLHSAHDAEITCLDYSFAQDTNSCLLASGSRDGLIHVLDADAAYELREVLYLISNTMHISLFYFL